MRSSFYIMMFFLNWYYRWFSNNDIYNLVTTFSILMFYLGVNIALKRKEDW